MRLRTFVTLGSCLLCLAVPAAGFDFYAGGPYRPDVPRPDEFLGYAAGDLHTHHFRMQAYFEALAAAVPERIELRTYGESYEKKELFLAVISSADNLAAVDDLRRRNLELADPLATTSARAAEIAAVAPVFVWLDYGNDGNETANIEAAMHVAYQLVAGESAEMERLRKESVVVLEPDHNPESHDRHVTWYNAFGVGDPDPLAMEHHAPWGMSTNNNHYQIDLNRDAWALTQRENASIAAAILRWRPQVFVDHHGQTENYFFAPPVEPINPSLPASHRRWYEAFGRGNAEAFDRQGWQYYVRDVFDLFYPGYWDSWPSLHGAIGMTYETDGGGHRGLAWRKRDGSIVTFRDGIAKHFTASLATLNTAVNNRAALLDDFYKFFAVAVDEGRRGSPARAYILDASTDPRRAAALAATLLRHGVEVGRASEPFTLAATPLVGGAGASRRQFSAGSYVIDMAQADKRTAATFLAPDATLDPAFVEEQLNRWSRNARRGAHARGERYEFYDVTSWSLPLAFGVEAFGAESVPAIAVEPLDLAGAAGSGEWDEEVPFSVAGLDAGVVVRIASVDGEREAVGADTAAASAYVFEGGSEGAMRLTARLLAEGFNVAVSMVPLEVGSADYARGSFVVRVNRNPTTLHGRIAELAAEAGVAVTASDTAFSASGKTGVGSNPVVGLRAPRVALVADEGVSITQYGAAWFTLEKRLGYPFTPIRFDELNRANLDRLDVIVLGDGSASTYRRALGEAGLERLGEWIEAGGSLITWGSGGASWALSSQLVGSRFAGSEDAKENGADAEKRAEARLAEIDQLGGDDAPRPPATSPSANPGRPQPIPGSVFRATLDLTHWMTLGFDGPELPVLMRGSRLLQLSDKGENPVVFSADGDLRLSGFVWPGNSGEWLAGSAHTLVEPHGKGQVVLFATDPNFRLVWRSTSRLFANAVLLGPSLGSRKSQGL